MIEHLDLILEKYNKLEAELTKAEVLSDVKKTREYSKQMSSMSDVVACYKKYKKVLTDIENTKEMEKDLELAEMAKEELTNLLDEKTKLESQLELLLIPKDPNDDNNVICEIRAGAGGEDRGKGTGPEGPVCRDHGPRHGNLQYSERGICDAEGHR